jgi:hypothetical protein
LVRFGGMSFNALVNVYLRVSPMKGVRRFGMKGELSPHYIGPFSILEKCGTVAYVTPLVSNEGL